MNKQKRQKKGYYIELGIAVGLPAGIPFGLVLGNIAFGPLIGVCLGLSIGYFLEKEYNSDTVEPTAEEKVKQQFISLVLLGIGIVAFIALTTLYFF